jgi:ectoine hydroxylase-related dioxygenase (phytanoyl-CoA dioxygenase family)
MKPPAFLDVPDPDSDGATFQRYTTEQGEFPIHTDMNLWYLQETKYQGGAALDHCPIGGGGFRCVPGFHKLEHIREYRKRFETGQFHFISTDSAGNKRRPAKMQPPSADSVFEFFLDDDWKAKYIEVPLEKGDFVVWNSRLPHSNLPNTSDRWRVHCYIRFVPADVAHQRYREEVKRAADTGAKPKFYSTGNRTSEYYDKWEMDGHDLSDVLSPLGRKLVGLQEW